MFLGLSESGALKAAGLPWDTYWKAHWVLRNRERLGIQDAFCRQGRNILINVQKANQALARGGA